jgi:adhesin transport system membrane fusion protein
MKRIIKKNKFPRGFYFNTHMIFITIVGFFLSVFFWAFTNELDIVSIASGKVVPTGKVRSIQHLGGGIIEKINVEEGTLVNIDDELIILQATSSQSDLDQITARIDLELIKVSRLMAEVNKKPKVMYSSKLRKKRTAAVQQSIALFKNRTKRLWNEKESGKKYIEQAEQNIIQEIQNLEGIKARYEQTKKTIEILKEQLKMSDDLLEEKLTNRYTHLNLLKELSNIEIQFYEDEQAILGAKSAVQVAKTSFEDAKILYNKIEIDFIEDARTQLEAAQKEIAELTERQKELEDNLERTTIVSPIRGIVNKLYINTTGGVIDSGETLLDIVPTDENLVIEADLPIKDIGFVSINQRAVVKLDSSDAPIFGSIEGVVKKISADTIEEDNSKESNVFYKIQVKTDKNFFDSGTQRYELIPGVKVMVNIHTGKRTVMEYMLTPFLKIWNEALRER